MSDKIKVVTGYKYGGKKIPARRGGKEFPLYLDHVSDVVTEEMLGWGKENHGVSEKKKVSKELTSYLKYIKSKLSDLNVKIISVGTGPDREHFFEWDK